LFWFEVETGVPRIIKQRRKINMQQRRRMFEKNAFFQSFYLVMRDGNSTYKNKAKYKINTLEKKRRRL
jgi:hypothetical protein